MLIYTTDDGVFAEKAVETLLSEGIQAYSTGNINGYIPTGPEPYCVYIESDSDRVRANEILLEMGAAPEKPLRLPTGPWVKWGMLAAGVCLGILIIVALS